MQITPSQSFVEALQESNILKPEQLARVINDLQHKHMEPRALARQLRLLGWLTPYQAEQLLLGNGKHIVVGSYVLLDLIGEGGAAKVFKGRHQRIGRQVAVKVLRHEQRANPHSFRRFEREIHAISQLSHPNIVHVYDAGETDHTLYYVMEFCEGVDLAKLVRRLGPLPVEEACNYVSQAAQGLQHIHDSGLIHRDIKPANLFLTTGGALVKILDLGLVSLCHINGLTVLTQEWSMVGTEDYISPEQGMNAHSIDCRADLYSLGCTFYYLLTGSPPFPEGSSSERLLQHRCLEPRPLTDMRPLVPDGVAEIVQRLMAKRPEDRYQCGVELVEDLAGFVSTHSLQ